MRLIEASIILLFVVLIVASCMLTDAPITATALPSQTATGLVSPTTTFTLMAGVPTNINTPRPITSSFHTLSSEDAYTRLQDVLKNNANCHLPCWWGIVTGKTTWKEAEAYLLTFNNIGYPIMGSDELFYITAQLQIPKEYGTLKHTYVVKNNIVIGINAYVYDWSPFIYLSNILTEYGPPDGVYITTYRYDGPYIVYLIYEKLGLLFLYSGGNVENIGNKVQNCFENLYSPFVYIWSVDDEPLTVNQLKDKYFSSESMPYPISLEEATGMDVNTFYEIFKNPDEANCLITPAELWPEP